MSPAWEVLLIVVPLAASLLTFLRPAWARPVAVAAAAAIVLLTGGLLRRLLAAGPWRHPLGGWGAPLGIDLQIDGLSALLVATTALVGGVTTVYALAYTRPEEGADGRPQLFWSLWFFLWGSLNVLFFSGDAFNLYISLELVTLAAIALVALAGTAVALTAAMRYMLVSLGGSLCYLLGVALLYGRFGQVDLQGLAALSAGGGAAVWTALALMTTGLLLKCALFPLHFWLPPAHASAPAPVSAILSALVVKAPFYLLLRLWFEVFTPGPGASWLLGGLGAAAVFWGAIQALRAARLKLLVAYSTVAQLGYLFLLFPLAAGGGFTAWGGAVLFLVAHACAKAAMFLAAGTILHSAGHDRIADFAALGAPLTVSLVTFGIAGVSLAGLPPSGSFLAKWMLLNAALATGQWWWVVVLLLGTLLAAAYVWRVLAPLFRPQPAAPLPHPPSAWLQWSALTLATIALLLGLVAEYPLQLAAIGSPFAGPVLLGGRP